jgi:lysophospholipase L1-like esterase
MTARFTFTGTAWLMAIGLAVFPAGVDASQDEATHYYVALGDSLAASAQPNGVLDQGYAEQLYAALAADDPKLELKKFGCNGESTVSMRLGSQYPSVVLSCATPRGYKDLYPKGTQLAEAVSFLKAHKGKVALVTISIGADDLYRVDNGILSTCLFEPLGCGFEESRMAENLTAILSELRTAAGPDVPIVGMNYYDVYAPLCNADSSLLFVCARIDGMNATLTSTYAAAGVPVADVAGAFENGIYPDSAQNVCAWTWACVLGDPHANTDGYAVIAGEFWKIVHP